MTYATLMVNLECGQSNANLLHLTNGLARRFEAAVIGIAARQPAPMPYTEGYMLSAEIIQDQRDAIDRELGLAEAEFRDLIEVKGDALTWCSTVTFEPPVDFVARAARGADLLLTRMPSRNRADETRVGAGSLVMQAGRPVLAAHPAITALALDHAVVGWKDTREARRAVLDSLPMLKLAHEVTMIAIVEEEDLADARLQLADLGRWLGRHGVAADLVAIASDGDDAYQLKTMAQDRGADLIVAGAYGHSRVREWAFGGVTRDLLLHTDGCTLLSH